VDCSNIRSKYNILGFDSIFLVLSGNIVNSTLTFELILHIVIPVFKLDMEFFTNHTKSSPEHPIISVILPSSISTFRTPHLNGK
ncbi:hypothetical protein, partial [Sporofaciens musculi]|uniref:hypothetical protein n=1 Tax=Sporofaciens musculi TaxID=2681861 RepID=UPI0025A16A46